jgi:aromatic ring-opening dioxygenase catalytic subunit (LigB family)
LITEQETSNFSEEIEQRINAMTDARLPTYFITHGGGPWPYMKQEMGGAFDRLEASIVGIRQALRNRPRAVLMISGHWETEGFAVSSGAAPGMVYDYYGFPEHTYHIHYRAPGSPALAARVQNLLRAGGLSAVSDPDRGFDHGTFSIMKPLYPDEDLPIVQLSLDASLDPALHLQVGRLLAPLREEGVLIIGSGSSFHNLRLRDARAIAPSKQFDDWLQHTLVGSSPEARRAALLDWESAPSARLAHPREEHLLPLMVTVGAAEAEAGTCIYRQDDLLGAWTASSFRFGDLAEA